MSIYRYKKRSLPELIQESVDENENKNRIIKNKKLDYLFTFINILFIVLWSFVIKYITELESNCNCSKNWKRDFIKYSLIIFIIILFIQILLRFIKKKIKINNIILLLIFIFNFIFTIIVAVYINELKKNECKCSESNIRTVLEIINYIRMSLMIIVALAIFYLYYGMYKKLKNYQ
jgi:amino acid transporter